MGHHVCTPVCQWATMYARKCANGPLHTKCANGPPCMHTKCANGPPCMHTSVPMGHHVCTQVCQWATAHKVCQWATMYAHQVCQWATMYAHKCANGPPCMH